MLTPCLLDVCRDSEDGEKKSKSHKHDKGDRGDASIKVNSCISGPSLVHCFRHAPQVPCKC